MVGLFIELCKLGKAAGTVAIEVVQDVLERYWTILRRARTITAIALVAIGAYLFLGHQDRLGWALIALSGMILVWRVLLIPIETALRVAASHATVIRDQIEGFLSQLFLILYFGFVTYLTSAWEHPKLFAGLGIILFLAMLDGLRTEGIAHRILKRWSVDRITSVSLPVIVGCLVVLHIIPESVRGIVHSAWQRLDLVARQTAEKVETTHAAHHAVTTLEDFQRINDKFAVTDGSPRYWYTQHGQTYVLIEKTGSQRYDGEVGVLMELLDQKAVFLIEHELAVRETAVIRDHPLDPPPASQPETISWPPPGPPPDRDETTAEFGATLDQTIENDHGTFTATIRDVVIVSGAVAAHAGDHIAGEFQISEDEKNRTCSFVAHRLGNGRDGQNPVRAQATLHIRAANRITKGALIGAIAGAALGTLNRQRRHGVIEGAATGATIGGYSGYVAQESSVQAGTPLAFRMEPPPPIIR